MREELQTLAQTLAMRVNRPVAIDDPQMQLLVHTAHDGPVDQARLDSLVRRQPPPDVVAWALRHGIAKASGAVRLPAWPERDLLPRVCAPARADGLLMGFVWLIDADESLAEEDLRVVEQVAAAVGAALAQGQRLQDSARARAREQLQSLLDGDASAADELELDDSQHAAVLAVDPTSPEELERAAGRLPPRCWVSSGTLLLMTGRRAVEELQRTARGLTGAHGGIGSVVPLQQAASSAEQARLALRVVRAVPSLRPVACWDDLGVYQLLAQLPPTAADCVPPALRRLFAADTTGQLVETLETWLDHAGDARATVEALQVHRTSLYYRFGRMEELADLRLSDGAQRLALHVGLKLARLTGEHPATDVESAGPERRQQPAAARAPSP